MIVGAVVLVAIALVVVTGRSQLVDQRNDVDAAWNDLREPLTARYLSLGEIAALAEEVGGARTVITNTQDALEEWTQTGATGTAARDPEREVRLANELEGLGARLATNVRESPRLNASADLIAAVDAYPTTLPPAELIDAYDRAVRTYDEDRNALRYRATASLFGFGSRSAFAPAGE